MRPFSEKLPFAKRDILIQGDSVRQIWGMEEPPLRKIASPFAATRRSAQCRHRRPIRKISCGCG
jgi:hypothetical protein